MSDYTPTTAWVKVGWMKQRAADGITAEQAHEEINRWLAEHDREVKAEAWDEGSRARHEAYMNDSEGFEPVNPYREVSK